MDQINITSIAHTHTHTLSEGIALIYFHKYTPLFNSTPEWKWKRKKGWIWKLIYYTGFDLLVHKKVNDNEKSNDFLVSKQIPQMKYWANLIDLYESVLPNLEIILEWRENPIIPLMQ